MSAYTEAQERYERFNVDTEAVIERLRRVSISVHCWQGDDVGGFENSAGGLGGGLAVTGHYPGKARTLDELMADLDQALRLIPGTHRVNLHAIYGDFRKGAVDRDAVEAEHFQGWIDWAKAKGLGLDFNPTCFSHPLAADGFTLAHPDPAIRAFWIEHGRRCRAIGAEMGRQLGSPAVTNVWIPDGYKDLPADRLAPRERLKESLDAVFAVKLDPAHNLDAVESKLFGIGSESYVVGSHEFYLGYAIRKQILLCLDAGHFHPTESIADKISALLVHMPELLLHVSRGVRWDSDHVVVLDDPTKAIMAELVRCDALDRTHIALDFFDASINRVAAWVIGTRATQKALLLALLEPRGLLRHAEDSGDATARLAMLETLNTLPFGAVWDEFCRRCDVPAEASWLAEVKTYEKNVLSKRG